MSYYRYHDNWRTTQFVCPDCKWTGPGSALVQGEIFDAVCEFNCPACHREITVIMHPTLAESRANWDNLSDLDRKQVEDMEKFQAEFERRKLSSLDQLPPIESKAFTLAWDVQGTKHPYDTVIKLGQQVVFVEPAVWEGYQRFIEVAGILRAKYGPALRDLVPTAASELYLYGDKSAAPQLIEDARKQIFGAIPATNPAEPILPADPAHPAKAEQDEDDEDLDDQEPEDEDNLDLFGFFVEDRHFLQDLKKAVRKLIRRSTTTPEQIYHLAKLLLALDRFPRPTPGMVLELSLGITHANGEKTYQDLNLDETSFRVGNGAWIIIDPAAGGDSSCDTILEVEVGGYRELMHPTAFAEWVEAFSARVDDPKQSLDISDSEAGSEIDWDAERDDADWGRLDSDYL